MSDGSDNVRCKFRRVGSIRNWEVAGSEFKSECDSEPRSLYVGELVLEGR